MTTAGINESGASMNTMPSGELLTRKEAAALLRISASWLSKGNGPTPIRLGRRVLYHQADVVTFIERLRAEAQEQCCTEDPTRKITNCASGTTAKKSVVALESQIAERLRQKHTSYAPKLNNNSPAVPSPKVRVGT